MSYNRMLQGGSPADGDPCRYDSASGLWLPGNLDPADIDFAATQRVLGRNTGGAGTGEEVTIAQALAWLLTTRGQIVRRGASAPEALAIGANGTVLTSDGTDAAWAAPGGAWTLLDTFSASGVATFAPSFTFAQGKTYLILLREALPVNNNVNLLLRINGASTFYKTATWVVNNTGGSAIDGGDGTALRLKAFISNVAEGGGAVGSVFFSQRSGNYSVFQWLMSVNDNGSLRAMCSGAGIRESTVTLASPTFSFSAGNISIIEGSIYEATV